MDATIVNSVLPPRRVHRPRLIPVLLIDSDGLLYKSRKFKDLKYVGDPRNTVKIFNDKGADEIILLDITATRQKRPPDFNLISEITSEAFMPLAYGGGITDFDQAQKLFALGVEKIILNSAAFEEPSLVKKIADFAGSQSVIVSLDIKKDMLGRQRVFTRAGTHNTGRDAIWHAQQAEKSGAGEIFLNSIDRDGMFSGYDQALCRTVAQSVSIPVIACGGAASVSDTAKIIIDTEVSAAAAGSIFVFQGPHRAVLITFPLDEELTELFSTLKESLNNN